MAHQKTTQSISERQLQEALIEAAGWGGWLAFHPYDSRRSAPGFPDLVLVRPPELIFWELKSAKGRVTPDQHQWIDALEQVPNIEAAVIRPHNLDSALRRLTRRPTPAVTESNPSIIEQVACAAAGHVWAMSGTTAERQKCVVCGTTNHEERP